METIHFLALPESFAMMIVLCRVETASTDLLAGYQHYEETLIKFM